MKQADIKIGCFYSNGQRKGKRFVVSVFNMHSNAVIDYIDLDTGTTRYCNKKSFAQWAKYEVRAVIWKRAKQ